MQSDELIPTRHSLLRRLKDWDDQASWQDFFDTYWQLIYRVAMKAGLTETEAQDVVQETIMTVAKNIKDFQVGAAHGSFKAWLLNATRWRINDQFRKRPPAAGSHATEDTTRTSTTDRIPDPATLDLSAFWEQDWEQILFDAAAAKVRRHADPEYFQMFDLHVLKGWPARKVANELDTKMGKVYFAAHKISRQIKKEVKRLEAGLP